MPDVFISYSSQDEALARKIHDAMSEAGLSVFLAGISLQEGNHWTPQIMQNLRESDWVFLLATRNAMDSKAVQQEVGGAMVSRKRLVPLFIDMKPEDAPRWIADYQGFSFAEGDESAIVEKVKMVATKINANKKKGLLALLIIAGIFFFAPKG